MTTTFDRFAADASPAAGAPVIGLTIALHPDLRRIGEHATLADLLEGKSVELSRAAPPFAPPGTFRLRALEDPSVSRQPIVFAPVEGGGVRIVGSGSRTKVVCGGTPVTGELVISAEQIRRGAVLQVGGGVVLVLHLFGAVPAVRDRDHGLVGESDGIHRVRGDIRRVADLAFPVLIRGETGTGKELVARGIHEASQRQAAPFVAVNLAAVPPALAASELFGAERGAYTGAVAQRGGYFEAARGGTLFLDEIGEAPPDVQVMLLRVLETGETQRIGAQKGKKADVRVLAATDADLEAGIQGGTFRAPLLHRLAAYEIGLPPLRERREDVALLVLRFLEEELRAIGEPNRLITAPGDAPWLPAPVMAQLVDHDWPGNVRQLRNVVRQLVVSSRGNDRLTATPVLGRLLATPAGAPTVAGAPASPVAAAPPARSARAATERRRPADVSEAEIRDALRACRWDLVAVADRLGISRPSLYAILDRTPSLRSSRNLTAEDIARAHVECGGDVDRMVDRLEISEHALRRRLRELGLR
ncbi:Flagellar regulatory protein FleQ [Minicystis rosea]|nr:Flagellar regulatory protein FleQ [Minicystis rosea]